MHKNWKILSQRVQLTGDSPKMIRGYRIRAMTTTPTHSKQHFCLHKMLIQGIPQHK